MRVVEDDRVAWVTRGGAVVRFHRFLGESMRGTLLAASAAMTFIATLPARAGEPGAFSWTGCHIGLHAGAASGHTKWRDPIPDGDIDATMTGQTANTDMSGAVYGGQGGCDWQFVGNWVAGIDGSVAAGTLTGTNIDQFNFNWALRTRNDWLGAVTGRIGYAVDHALVYGRAGAAFAHSTFEIENANIFLGSPQTTRFGFVAGAGLEWAISTHLSAFAEGDFYKFPETSINFQGNVPLADTPPFTVRTSETIEAIKFGVNYRF